ncbi:hypothetical protein BGZ46_002682 [Entomortierella lignicola]|nr:hypothetical protein BGZ46_002682 [Entomortierella lignicola]
MDSIDSSNGQPSGMDTAVFIYAVLVVSTCIALFYFARTFLAHRRNRQRILKSPVFEVSPPTYFQHFDDIPVDDQSCNASTNGIVTHTTFPASALVRGENYYVVTPRVRVYSSNSLSTLQNPYSLSRSGSGASTRSTFSDINNDNDGNSSVVIPIDSPPAPYASTDRLPMTEIGVRPPAYEDLPRNEVSRSIS